ncbi:MAG: PilZ domain-containing protein [Bdellovibrionaceae bacterium]|nr:PilZ domain-containing protein [Pseudobdellovibrionaceae bacterium]
MKDLHKQRVIIASTSEQENYILKRKIDPILSDLGAIQFMSVRPQGVHAALDASVSMVIINTPSFTVPARVAITDARRLGYRGPILVISKMDSVEGVREIRAMEKVVLLERPYEVKDLQGIVRKFILARKVEQRVFRRYHTVQKAEVEVVGYEKKSITTLFNLSRGGCYFEFPRTMNVKVGDTLKMTIELAEVNRRYAMPAKIVWMTTAGQSGGHGVGVEFIGRGNVEANNPLGL